MQTREDRTTRKILQNRLAERFTKDFTPVSPDYHLRCLGRINLYSLNDVIALTAIVDCRGVIFHDTYIEIDNRER